MLRHPLRSRAAVLALVAPVAAILALVVPDPAAARSAGLRLQPNDGPPGTRLVADGRDFGGLATGTLTWEDGTVLGDFAADQEGNFAVEITIPIVAAGDHAVTARSGPDEASDVFATETGDDTTSVPAPSTPVPSAALPPASARAIGTAVAGGSPDATPGGTACASNAGRRVDVSTAAELRAALSAAQPGDLILLADGTYAGTFVAAASGTAGAGIALCGSRRAVLDGGDVGNGYALHVTGDYWTVAGITISNALKGVMLDDADFTVLDHLAVHTIGHEAVHFRTNSSDNVIEDSEISDSGLKNAKFGEGVYIGSAVSNCGRYTNGDADRSDRNQVLHNRIWNTTAEAIDVKEGTTGGLIEGNVFDGARLTGADSWVDVKGNGYVVRGNSGTNSSTDGFQTHVINDLPWGRDNVFDDNVARVDGSGYGFYIHEPDESGNVVTCTNQVSGAAKGFANVECA